MPTRRLDLRSPRPAYMNDVLSFAGRLRLYNVLRPAANPAAVQIGTLYQGQLDSTKAWLDARYAELLASIAVIRGGAITRAIWPIEPILAPRFNDYGDFIPSTTKPHVVHNATYHAASCQAIRTPAGQSAVLAQAKGKLPGKVVPLDPKAPEVTGARPDPVWPPWPAPIPPLLPPPIWRPALEEKYSYAYAYYWLFVQLYSADPTNRVDLRALAYFAVNFWLYYYDLYRVTHTEAATKQICLISLAALQDAIC